MENTILEKMAEAMDYMQKHEAFNPHAVSVNRYCSVQMQGKKTENLEFVKELAERKVSFTTIITENLIFETYIAAENIHVILTTNI